MYTTSIVIDEVIDTLAAFIDMFVDGAPVIRGQANRTPPPSGSFVELTELLSVDIQTPWSTYDNDDLDLNISGSVRIDVQIDFYNPKAGDYCRAVQSAFRTGWGFDQFPDNIKPLYTSDGVQSPMITGEQQYNGRWTLTASLQYNPVVTVPQQSANVATVATTELIS
jgi:hypothetical protein